MAEAFAAAYRRVVPDSPLNSQPARRPLNLYQAMYDKFADHIGETAEFGEPKHWRFDWEHSYTLDQWLDLLPTTGGLTQLSAVQLAEVLGSVGSAIVCMGGTVHDAVHHPGGRRGAHLRCLTGTATSGRSLAAGTRRPGRGSPCDTVGPSAPTSVGPVREA